MKIRLIYFALILVMICGLNGCSKEPSYSIDEKKQMVLEYLEKKYGEKFDGVSYAPSEVLKQHDEFWVYPQNGNKKNDVFIVTGSYSKELKKYVMHDAYFGILIHDEYLKYVNALVHAVIDEFYITVDTKSDNPYTDRYTKETEIKDLYLKNELRGIYPYVHIYIKQSSVKDKNIDNIVKEITETMKDNNLESIITLVVVFDYKYDYFVNNISKIKINDDNRKEYYVYEKDRKSPYYKSLVYENNNNLEIDIWEEE